MSTFLDKIVLATVISATGCAGAFTAEPSRVRSIEDELAAVRAAAEIQRSSEQLTAEDIVNVDESERNRIVYARFYEVDLRYREFERNLLLELRNIDLLASIVDLGVDIGGTFAQGDASRILSAISGGISGAQTAFNEEVLFDRTVLALVSQMKDDRATVKLEILFRLNQDMTSYPITAALADIERYRVAGTIPSAIFNLGETAAQNAIISEAELEEARTIGFNPDRRSDRLVGYLTEGRAVAATDEFVGLITTERAQIVDGEITAYFDRSTSDLPAELQNIGLLPRIYLFIIGDGYDDARSEIVSRLIADGRITE